jgi:non-heme chloroperoxidase
MPFIETDDRTRLFYTDGGSGRPVVFVASAWLSARMWERQMADMVEQGLRCIAYDRRGHGRSDWPCGAMTTTPWPAIWRPCSSSWTCET